MVYTQALDARHTINGDVTPLVINGRSAIPTTLMCATTYDNGTVYVTAQNALRSMADFQRKVAVIYTNGHDWFLLAADGRMSECASEHDAITRGTALAA